MCWNMEVSIGFGIIHLITFIIVLNKRPYHYLKFLIFLGFYLIMEWFQALQWYLNVDNQNNKICNLSNTYLTIFSYILIWLQPIMFSSFANQNKFSLCYAIMTFIVCLINLFLGFKYPASELDYLTFIGSTNYGNQTCTYKGIHGHLLWKFKINTITYQPTHYVYYSIIILIIIFQYDNILKSTLGLGWILSLILAIFIRGLNNELPAFWCLLSVFADIPILIYTFIEY